MLQFPSDVFARFVRYMRDERVNTNRTFTVHDLIVAVRNERLVEFSAWSFEDLDTIEQQATKLDGQAVVSSDGEAEPLLRSA